MWCPVVGVDVVSCCRSGCGCPVVGVDVMSCCRSGCGVLL